MTDNHSRFCRWHPKENNERAVELFPEQHPDVSDINGDAGIHQTAIVNSGSDPYHQLPDNTDVTDDNIPADVQDLL